MKNIRVEDTYSMSSLGIGETATVHGILVTGSMRTRLQDLGLVSGTRVKCTRKNASGDLAAYSIRGTTIALRCEDSGKIIVSPDALL